MYTATAVETLATVVFVMDCFYFVADLFMLVKMGLFKVLK
jgi:hypothetical protein